MCGPRPAALGNLSEMQNFRSDCRPTASRTPGWSQQSLTGSPGHFYAPRLRAPVRRGRCCSQGAILIRTELRQGSLWCIKTIQLTQSRQCPLISCWARRPAHHSLECESRSKCLATFVLFHHPVSRETPHFPPETLTCLFDNYFPPFYSFSFNRPLM